MDNFENYKDAVNKEMEECCGIQIQQEKIKKKYYLLTTAIQIQIQSFMSDKSRVKNYISNHYCTFCKGVKNYLY